MSDVNITFTWYDLVWFYITASFWQLTLALAVFGALVWFRRKSRILWVLGIIVACLWLMSAESNAMLLVRGAIQHRADVSDFRSRTTTLAHAATIGGLALPAGTTVTRVAVGSDELEELVLPGPAMIGGAPLVGDIHFTGGQLNGDVTLARDATIRGVPCSSHGPVTFQYGELQSCLLSRPARIGSIPCTGTADVYKGDVECSLANDYRRFGYTWRAGTKISDDGSLVVFGVGPRPPSLHALGIALGDGATVQFMSGRITYVDLKRAPLSYRGCTLETIVPQGNGFEALPATPCALPRDPNNGYVKLPSPVFR